MATRFITLARVLADSVRDTSLSINMSTLEGRAHGWMAVLMLGAVAIAWLR